MASKTLHLGRTYLFYPNEDGVILKDGAPWDLAGATVTVLFEAPDGTARTLATTVVNAASGLVYAECDTMLLDQLGVWRRTWRVVQGSIDVTLEEWYSFLVAA